MIPFYDNFMEVKNLIKNKTEIEKETERESSFIQYARGIIEKGIQLHLSIKEVSMRATQIEILKVLERHGPLIRGQIGETKTDTLLCITKLARSTLYDNLEKLEKKKLVERFPYNNGQRGANVKYWRIVE